MSVKFLSPIHEKIMFIFLIANFLYLWTRVAYFYNSSQMSVNNCIFSFNCNRLYSRNLVYSINFESKMLTKTFLAYHRLETAEIIFLINYLVNYLITTHLISTYP